MVYIVFFFPTQQKLDFIHKKNVIFNGPWYSKIWNFLTISYAKYIIKILSSTRYHYKNSPLSFPIKTILEAQMRLLSESTVSSFQHFEWFYL